MSKTEKLIKVAQAVADLSECRRQVGCVLTDAWGHIKATGYNGTPKGMGSCACKSRRSGMDLDGCPAVHAEMNALMQCSDIQELTTAYVTTKPCIHCIKMLLNTSIQTIYYVEEYPHQGVQELWESVGRLMVKIPCT